MAKVLPAQAGVILTFAFALISKGCTPRASGGDPQGCTGVQKGAWYSPRKRG